MRRRLERFVGQRRIFTATFTRYGKAKTSGGKRIGYMLIQDVRDSRGRFVTAHVWMPLRPEDFVTVDLEDGDVIRFEAEVNRYSKGNLRRRRFDYGLRKPAGIELVEIAMEMEA